MASAIWKKLNLKDNPRITVLNAPDSFETEIETLSGIRVDRKPSSLSGTTFMLAFVTQRLEIERLSDAIAAMADGDVTVWFSYPKQRSKRYACDVNRDTGWEPLGVAGYEAVRQVAIDEDWSALRFRRVEYIKKMKRNGARALTPEGRKKTHRS